MTGDDDLLTVHVVMALVAHCRWCRSRGHAFPAALEQLLSVLTASGGQDRPIFGEMPGSVDPDPMPAPLLLDDIAAGRQLGVSARTVRRLRKSEALPTVLVGRRRFTRREDIAAFVASGGV
jgi:hypothetical protein